MNDFAYRQKTFALEDTAGQTQALHEDGFALIPGALATEEIDALRAGIERLHPFGFDQVNDLQEHYKCVFNRETLFRDLSDRPGIVELAESAMGSQCHIIGMTAWRSHPGYSGWGNHTDEIMVPLPEFIFAESNFRLPILICTAHYYLNDIPNVDYCPTYVIPGSHKSGRRPDKGEEEWQGRALEPVLVKAGDVLFFRSEVWHSGSANRSNAPRYLIQTHYSHRFISQKFSPWPWVYNPEILATANERQLRLMGKHPESNYG